MDTIRHVLNLLNVDMSKILAELSRKCIFIPLTVGAGTSTFVGTLLLSLGFGPAGVAAGSSAAAFQAWMYGGFTPAAGIFATLTSLGMLGLLSPIVGIISLVFGAVAALVASSRVSC